MGTIGQVLIKLRESRKESRSVIAKVASISGSSYIAIERDEREASFIVIYRICNFYDISIQEFADMLSPTELERRELSSIRTLEKRKAKQEKALRDDLND